MNPNKQSRQDAINANLAWVSRSQMENGWTVKYYSNGHTVWYDETGQTRKRVSDGYIAYYDEQGNWHKEDGPARINVRASGMWLNNGIQTTRHPLTENEWWYHGKQINANTQEEFEQLLKLKAFW